jgi:hypothetical protein
MLQKARRFHKPSELSAIMRDHDNLDVIADTCKASGDTDLYEAAIQVMIAKLDRITEDRESCCRRIDPRKKNSVEEEPEYK